MIWFKLSSALPTSSARSALLAFIFFVTLPLTGCKKTLFHAEGGPCASNLDCTGSLACKDHTCQPPPWPKDTNASSDLSEPPSP
jgi:hypothetical protein